MAKEGGRWRMESECAGCTLHASLIPKGLCPPAQGCEGRATLGDRPEAGDNPERVVAPSCCVQKGKEIPLVDGHHKESPERSNSVERKNFEVIISVSRHERLVGATRHAKHTKCEGFPAAESSTQWA